MKQGGSVQDFERGEGGGGGGDGVPWPVSPWPCKHGKLRLFLNCNVVLKPRQLLM